MIAPPWRSTNPRDYRPSTKLKCSSCPTTSSVGFPLRLKNAGHFVRPFIKRTDPTRENGVSIQQPQTISKAINKAIPNKLEMTSFDVGLYTKSRHCLTTKPTLLLARVLYAAFYFNKFLNDFRKAHMGDVRGPARLVGRPAPISAE